MISEFIIILIIIVQISPSKRWMRRYQPKDTPTSIIHKIFYQQLIGKEETNKDGYDGNCNQYFASRFTFLLPQNGFDIQVCCFSLIYCFSFNYWNINYSNRNITLYDNKNLTFRFHVISHMNIFFTCKNTLVLLLQTYRLLILVLESRPR